MSKKIPVCVVGPLGRMGQRVTRLLGEARDLEYKSALQRSDAPLPHRTGLVATSDPDDAVAAARVVIDFSAPPACQELAAVCARHGAAYVVASTGLEKHHHEAVDAQSTKIPILQAANLSLGVNVLLELVELAARRLPGFDIEISEIHHRFKRDAPSGTALGLGEAVGRGRPGLRTVAGRSTLETGLGQARGDDELGYGVLRGGDVSGEHTVFYFGNGERVELTHRATTADIFAQGALTAARWLVQQPPGRYSMRDVLTFA